MIRVALLLSALVQAHAHIYERCELARELTGLGVHRDQLAMWVCIAYHESRFDTSARNYGSGDHGLFQISELYWCGPGKACGVPCTAFRDEDISDDLQCALRIHREHTVLQGDGYMAWTVYPYHCKNINRKKYLADCDASLKNVTVDPDRARGQKSLSTTTPRPFDADFYAKNLPTFLAINSIFENSQAKQFKGDDEKVDWVNFKFDNIDNIKLPKVSKETIIDFVRPAYTTTTTESYEENYPKPNYKNDWVNYKFDNIDNLKLPAKSSANQNNGLPSWLNIKIDSSVDDLKLPPVVKNAVKYVPVTTTPAYTYYDENIPRQKYKNDWVNLRIDNIDDLQLPVLSPKTQGSRRNNGLNWLNIKIDNKIDDIDLDELAKKNKVEKAVPVQITTSTVRTTTIDPELIGIKPPMPRKIESNQFRRRMMSLMSAMMTLHNITKEELPDKEVTEPSSISNRIPLEVSTIRPKPGRYPMYTEIRRNKTVTERPSTTSSVFSFRWNSPRSEVTTQKTTTQQSTTFKDNSQYENVNNSTEKNILKEIETVTKTTTTTKQSRLFEYRFNDEVSETINKPKPKEDDIPANRLPSNNTKEPLKTTTTTAKPSFAYSSTTLKPETTMSSGRRFSFGWNKQFQSGFTFKPFTFSTARSTITSTSRPEFSSTIRAYSTKALEETKNATQTTIPSTTTTVRPWSWNNPRWTLDSLNTQKTSVKNSSSTGSSVSSTKRPEIQRQRWSFGTFGTDFKTRQRQTNSSRPATVQTTTTTAKPTMAPITSKPEETNVTSRIVTSQNVTPKPSEASTKVVFTFKPFTTTVKPDTSRESQKNESNTSVASDTATRTTPSIFDLYLRPEKFSTVRQYQFPTFKPSGNKLTIFSGGTTPRSASYVKP